MGPSCSTIYSCGPTKNTTTRGIWNMAPLMSVFMRATEPARLPHWNPPCVLFEYQACPKCHANAWRVWEHTLQGQRGPLQLVCASCGQDCYPVQENPGGGDGLPPKLPYCEARRGLAQRGRVL